MPTRRDQERDRRHRLIVDTAREIAEQAGWDAVTTRRLSERVGYSQPVLYSHFANREAIVSAVAVQGFTELAAALPPGDLRALATAYLRFAEDHPALYDAMFALPLAVPFAQADTPPALTEAFARVRAVTATDAGAEVLWAGLHGLATLTRAGRLRAGGEQERLEALIASARA